MMIVDGGFKAEILADSQSPKGSRVTTFCATYPRKIHSEMLTHAEFARNAASSRAIPVAKLIEMVETNPVAPIWWGKNQSGMSAKEELDAAGQVEAKRLWLLARDNAVIVARQMVALGLHKQIINRILEPWMWITVILTGSSFANFRALRCHEMAEPHFQKIAGMMMSALDASVPRKLQYGEWHLPLILDADWEQQENEGGEPNLIKVSVGRCARVSYLTHEGKRDLKEDIALHDRLMVQKPLHASPASHQAMACAEALGDISKTGNLRGEWFQYRKMFANEYVH